MIDYNLHLLFILRDNSAVFFSSLFNSITVGFNSMTALPSDAESNV